MYLKVFENYSATMFLIRKNSDFLFENFIKILKKKGQIFFKKNQEKKLISKNLDTNLEKFRFFIRKFY